MDRYCKWDRIFRLDLALPITKSHWNDVRLLVYTYDLETNLERRGLGHRAAFRRTVTGLKSSLLGPIWKAMKSHWFYFSNPYKNKTNKKHPETSSKVKHSRKLFLFPSRWDRWSAILSAEVTCTFSILLHHAVTSLRRKLTLFQYLGRHYSDVHRFGRVTTDERQADRELFDTKTLKT